ncbi:aldose 1-epimerase family protein [Novosphingobium mangrovi (ex Huang et al. 2023)]|uniref:Aldose 1-epimerase family protein n=1 Tax=Novosphingobium mangrovi (ex Huang et al. 2023) TaxID=2976432 RepID=A0ABT2I302_9SPHN|nr:aldose 1-epimerase family protein [Novosphingobium mangrovi (ex Huang et al. 2023)]MCT2399179.1 aldose 1-epimerase family protein [Novosphingobium mangrovi (ex Huang et al. 2023)]
MEFVTISSGDLTARINPMGAELWSLTDSRGREFMTDADPAFWSGHAPLLFPVVGGLNANRYRLDGAEYELPRHGFARHSAFEVVEVGENEARFRLRDSAETRAVFPFAFELEVVYRLEDATLHVTATVRNPGTDPLPFSLGYHPAFAWPLPGGADKADHVIAFAEPEPGPIRRLDPSSGLMAADAVPTPVEGHHLALDESLFEADAVIWDALASRALTFGAPGGAQLAISFPDTPMLGIWQKPGAAFLCIEPWQGHADPIGFTNDFREKPGIVQLAPGESRSFRMDVTILTA